MTSSTCSSYIFVSRKNPDDLRNLNESVRDRLFAYEKRVSVDGNWYRYDLDP